MFLRPIARHSDRTVLPARRSVVRFEFRNLPRSRRSLTAWWLVWDRGGFDACVSNPGFDVDLVVNASIDVLVKVWMDGVGLTEARLSGDIRFTGNGRATDAFVRLLDLQPMPCSKTRNCGPSLESNPEVRSRWRATRFSRAID